MCLCRANYEVFGDLYAQGEGNATIEMLLRVDVAITGIDYRIKNVFSLLGRG